MPVVIVLDQTNGDIGNNITVRETNSLLKKKLLSELEKKRKHVKDLKECKSGMLFLSHYPIIDDQDISYWLKILEICPTTFEYVPTSLKNNRNFILNCLKVKGDLFTLLHDGDYFKNDPENEFIQQAIRLESVVKALNYHSILKLPYRPLQYLISNREFLMKAVSINPTIFSRACRPLKDDDELLFEALKYNRQHLRFANWKQMRNRNIIFRACETKESVPFGYSLQSVLTMMLPVAKNNPELALEILEKDPESAACAIRNFRTHKKIIMKAIEVAPHLIFKVLNKQGWFPNINEILLLALKKDCSIFNVLGPFRLEKEILIYAYKNCRYINYVFIPNQLLQDKDCAMAALRISPSNMSRIDENMRKDRDLILAIADNHCNIYLSQEFKDEYLPDLANDKEFLIRAAVLSTGILRAASEAVLKDRELVLSVLQSSRYLTDVHLIKDHLKSDMEIIEKFIEKTPPHIFDIDLLPKHLVEDNEFFYRMICKRPHLIETLSHNAFFKDKRNILKLISNGHSCYQILSQELREDKDVKLGLIKLGDYPRAQE